MNNIQIMGILNLTPDSFFDGGKHNTIKKALNHVEKLINDGAHIIDIGGESTKPYSKSISIKEENQRVYPVLKEIRKEFPKIKLSIDTTKSEIMKMSIDEGIDIINDISGLMWDRNAVNIVADSNLPIIIMHSPWKPHEMQDKFNYVNGVIIDIISFFNERINYLIKNNVKKNNIIIDPGIGFGKSIEDNFEIISNLSILKKFNTKILVGASNKSYIFNTIKDKKIENRVEGNAITEFLAFKNGANILRVHDVASTVRTLKLSSMFWKIYLYSRFHFRNLVKNDYDWLFPIFVVGY